MRKGMLAPQRELKLVQKSNGSRVLRALVDLVTNRRVLGKEERADGGI